MLLLWQRSWRLPTIVASLFCLTLVATQSGSSVYAQVNAQSAKQKRRRGLDLFERKIRPVLIEHCYECHAEDSDDVGGNLLVDTRSGMIDGGDSGPSLRPGKPGASLLLKAIEYQDLEMPPDEKLPDSVAADFRRWISLGAPDPRKRKRPEEPATEASQAEPVDLWSLQPIQSVAVPVSDHTWPQTEIDQFIHVKRSANSIEPNPDAEPSVLLRRLYFDLIGLPPPPEAVAAFTADPSPANYTDVVDALLSSQAFGERWGRHWLDVARYGESAGSSRDVLMLYAWRYRDYVIDAINDDLPFNEFVAQQIAGDLLDAESDDDRKRMSVATGLLAIGSKSLNGGNLTYDIIDDQIDVVSKSILGLTVSCARCHDHKFDPIPTADYYALAGIFLSTDTRYGGSIKRPTDAKSRSQAYLTLDRDADTDAESERATIEKQYQTISKQVRSSQKRVADLISTVPKPFQKDASKVIAKDLDPKQQQRIRQYKTALRILNERKDKLKTAAADFEALPQREYALGTQDAKTIADSKILIRGEKGQPGKPAPRGFLSSIQLGSHEDDTSIDAIDSSESGRRQLAQWLTHPNNPLTARVAANRIWHHLMGQGIVSTVDNFGVSGLPPSHPELLDYLAGRFVDQHSWSRKRLIREIVVSRTYRLSSRDREDASQVDPDNVLRWKMDRRRLEAEPLRDAVLSVSGLLRSEPLKGSLVLQIGEGEVGRNINTSVLEKPFNHRSVYLPIIRGIIPEQLKLFDFPEPSNVQGRRDSNTTPTQSLYFMNSPEVIRASKHFATELLREPSCQTDRQRVELAYLRCFGRHPSADQIDQSVGFIHEMRQSDKKDDSDKNAWTTFCQSLIASAPFRFID